MEARILSCNIEQLSRQRNLFLLLTLMLVVISCGLTFKLLAVKEKTILVPGLVQEVWSSGNLASQSYLEETSLMYLPLLLDLNKEVIGFKEGIIFKYISQSDASYMKKIREYYADCKEKYKKFGLSTYFSVKNLQVDMQKLSVRANGVLTSRYGDRGIEVKDASYYMSFELVGGTPRLKEFVRIKSQEEIKNIKKEQDSR